MWLAKASSSADCVTDASVGVVSEASKQTKGDGAFTIQIAEAASHARCTLASLARRGSALACRAAACQLGRTTRRRQRAAHCLLAGLAGSMKNRRRARRRVGRVGLQCRVFAGALVTALCSHAAIAFERGSQVLGRCMLWRGSVGLKRRLRLFVIVVVVVIVVLV